MVSRRSQLVPSRKSIRPCADETCFIQKTGFLMQIASLILSPAFIQGGLYVLLGRIIPILGAQYSFIHPVSYTIIFVIGDMISLIIQAVGGGRASAAETNEAADNGAMVMGESKSPRSDN